MKSIISIGLFLLLCTSTLAHAGECVLGRGGIPHGLDGLKQALGKAVRGNCTSDDVKWRNRYREFFGGATHFQIIRLKDSEDISVTENFPEVYGSDVMPTIVVADDDASVSFAGSGVGYAFNVKGNKIVFDNISISGFADSAVRLSGNGNVLIRCRVTSNNKNGIVVTGRNNWIVDTEVSRNGVNGIVIGQGSAGQNCPATPSELGRATTIKGGDIYGNGLSAPGTSCADVSDADSIASCWSLSLETKICHELLSEEEACEEPNVPMDDSCGRYWISRNRCKKLWSRLSLDGEAALQDAVSAMYAAHPGVHGGSGVLIDAYDVRILSWDPDGDTYEPGALFSGGVHDNKSHDIYVNSLPPAVLCHSSDASIDLNLVQTALVSQTAVGILTISRFPLPVVSQLASTASALNLSVSGWVRLSDDPTYIWNESTLGFASMHAEVFIKDPVSGVMKYAGRTDVDESGRFVINLTPPFLIDDQEVREPVFVASIVDDEFKNTSPFLGAHTASPDFDDDSDGLSNSAEDINLNGIVDEGETDPLNPDSDADGLTDGEEKLHDGRVARLIEEGFVFASLDRLDPLNFDSDNDCLPDGLELGVTKDDVENLISRMPAKPKLTITSPCQKIINNSTVTSIENVIWYDEVAAKLWNNVSMLYDLNTDSLTDPTSSDSDRDGTLDGVEDSNFNGICDALEDGNIETDPSSSDSDGDGIVDGEEGDRDGDGKIGPDETDPLLADTDGDGVNDGQERRIGTYPNACDSDEDGLSDGVEMGAIKPQSSDSACHGLEAAGSNYQNPNVLDPLNPDSDNDGRLDGVEDENGNGWVDSFESDPTIEDTDRDGLLDGLEAAGDFNGDGVPDFDLRLITGGPKCSPPEDISDLDCDGVPNWIDIDSDEDGCPDMDEGGRRDQNANGIPDVFDNEAKSCTESSGGGGSISFGGGGEGSLEKPSAGIGATPAWLRDTSGGSACALMERPIYGPDIISTIISTIGLYLIVLPYIFIRKRLLLNLKRRT